MLSYLLTVMRFAEDLAQLSNNEYQCFARLSVAVTIWESILFLFSLDLNSESIFSNDTNDSIFFVKSQLVVASMKHYSLHDTDEDSERDTWLHSLAVNPSSDWCNWFKCLAFYPNKSFFVIQSRSTTLQNPKELNNNILKEENEYRDIFIIRKKTYLRTKSAQESFYI